MAMEAVGSTSETKKRKVSSDEDSSTVSSPAAAAAGELSSSSGARRLEPNEFEAEFWSRAMMMNSLEAEIMRLREENHRVAMEIARVHDLTRAIRAMKYSPSAFAGNNNDNVSRSVSASV